MTLTVAIGTLIESCVDILLVAIEAYMIRCAWWSDCAGDERVGFIRLLAVNDGSYNYEGTGC